MYNSGRTSDCQNQIALPNGVGISQCENFERIFHTVLECSDTDTDNCHTRHGIFLLDLTIRLLFLSKYYPDRIGILNC